MLIHETSLSETVDAVHAAVLAWQNGGTKPSPRNARRRRDGSRDAKGYQAHTQVRSRASSTNGNAASSSSRASGSPRLRRVTS